jgi:hypothetical protein
VSELQEKKGKSLYLTRYQLPYLKLKVNFMPTVMYVHTRKDQFVKLQ